jgi:hypothetical protein
MKGSYGSVDEAPGMLVQSHDIPRVSGELRDCTVCPCLRVKDPGRSDQALPGPGLAGQQDQGSVHQAAAGHPVELVDAGLEPDVLGLGHLVQADQALAGAECLTWPVG